MTVLEYAICMQIGVAYSLGNKAKVKELQKELLELQDE